MAMDMKSSPPEILKVYKRRVQQRRRVPAAVIPDEIVVFEILVRLPVKALVRFKSLSKTWRAIISDPCFIRLHLQQSAKNHQHKPSFLIIPHTLDKVIDGKGWPTTFSNHIPFYSWEDGQDSACLVHSTTFPAGEFRPIYTMVHCDGLVLLLADTNIYVFNPAIHDVLKLHDGQKDVFLRVPTVSLGLDPRTNKYKVVRFFYRSLDFSERTYSMGMEICTIGGDDIDDLCWRSIAEDPPLPVQQGVVTHFKGSLYLLVWDELLETRPQGVLRFDLQDETFSFISHPKLLSLKEERRPDFVPWRDEWFYFTELGRELCLAQWLDGKEVMFMLRWSGDGRHEWVQHHVVVVFPQPFGTLSVIPSNKDGLLIRSGNGVYHYEGARQDAMEVVQLGRLRYRNPGSSDFVARDVFMTNMLSYTESLIPVTKPREAR